MTNGPYIVDETCLVFAKNIETENEELRAEIKKLQEKEKDYLEMLRRQAQTIVKLWKMMGSVDKMESGNN